MKSYLRRKLNFSASFPPRKNFSKKNSQINTQKPSFYQKNWDGFSKFRRLKMTSNLRRKLNFSQSTPPWKIFSKFFFKIINQKPSFYPKIGMGSSHEVWSLVIWHGMTLLNGGGEHEPRNFNIWERFSSLQLIHSEHAFKLDFCHLI